MSASLSLPEQTSSADQDPRSSPRKSNPCIEDLYCGYACGIRVTIDITHQYQEKQKTKTSRDTTGYLKVKKNRTMESHGLGCLMAGIGLQWKNERPVVLLTEL